MSLIMPNSGKMKFLEMALKDAAPNAQALHLFVNNITPSDTSVLSDFTEMTTHGYTALIIPRAGWTVASVDGTITATNIQSTFTFTYNSTSGDTVVYGYYITTNDGTEKILWADVLDSSFMVSSTGQQLKVIPTITIQNYEQL